MIDAGDMFKKARQVLSEDELEELGKVMLDRKNEAMREQGAVAR